MKNKTVLKITLSGMLLAIGIVLPFLTGQIPEIGAMLCPMHIPVIIKRLLRKAIAIGLVSFIIEFPLLCEIISSTTTFITE